MQTQIIQYKELLSLIFFLMGISFLMPHEILRKLVMTFDNVVAFNRKLLFSAGDKYFTFCCLV